MLLKVSLSMLLLYYDGILKACHYSDEKALTCNGTKKYTKQMKTHCNVSDIEKGFWRERMQRCDSVEQPIILANIRLKMKKKKF